MVQYPTLQEVINEAQKLADKHDKPYYVFHATGMVDGLMCPITCSPVGSWHRWREGVEEARRKFHWLEVCYPDGWERF